MADQTPPRGNPGGTPSEPRTGDLAQLARFVATQERKPFIVGAKPNEDDSFGIMMMPDGYRATSLKPLVDEWRTRPELRAGTTQLNDLASFCAWTKRHQDEHSVVYFDDNALAPSLTAVIDHDEAGPDARDKTARFGRHRGVYAFPYSREWQEWTKACGQGLGAGEFAAFFERRIGDVMPPPYEIDGEGTQVFQSQDPEIRKLVMTLGKKFATPQEIVRLTRGVEINAASKASVRLDRDTGEHFVEYSEENGQGSDRIKPPNAFLIVIPVLHNGTAFMIAVHLRYRAAGGKVLWYMDIHQPERVLEEVFTAALREVLDKTGLEPLRGVAPKPH